MRSLLDLYGGGLARMMEIVYDSPAGGELFDRFAADDLVSSLLLLHDLHPEDTETRILRALDGVRPYLGSHGGDVTLLGIDGTTSSACGWKGAATAAPSSSITMKLAIEKAIGEAAPEVTRIEVEGVAEPGRHRCFCARRPAAGSLVQIGLQCPSEIEAQRGGSDGGDERRRARASSASCGACAGRGRRPPAEERCELCSRPIPSQHSHVVHVEKRNLLCACRPCYLLFTSQGAAGGKYRAVPESYLDLGDRRPQPLAMGPAAGSGRAGLLLLQQQPGAHRGLLSQPGRGHRVAAAARDLGGDRARRTPRLAALIPDVEALLVWKRPEGCASYVVPIDACYELVGIVRRHWRGFHGGEEAWQAISAFFAGLAARSEPPRSEAMRR